MANGQGQDTLTPASPEAIAAFQGLDEGKKRDALGKMSDGAKQALLIGLRTLKQSKQYGTTSPTNRKATEFRWGQAGYTPQTAIGQKKPVEFETGAFERDPTIPSPGSEGAEDTGDRSVTGLLADIGYGTPESRKMVSGQGKWLGAGVATALAPETGGLSEAALLALLGGATGEAGEQLTKQAIGIGDVPESSGEAAKSIGKAGLETAAAEFLFGAASRTGEALLRHFNPYTQGIQSLFRSFGPPSAPEFRQALEDSAWDLQRIYSAIDKRLASADVRGGVLNEDMRFRVTLNAVNDYLRDMYQFGRQAQIQVASQYGSRVVMNGDAQVLQETAKRLSRSLPTNSVAQRAAAALADNPLRPLPISEADELARAVNVELRKFESMTGSEQAALRMSSRIKSGLKDMDVALSNSLNSKLREVGQPGLEAYERRYAALSRVREQLEHGMNKSEAMSWNQRLHSFFSLHGINVRSHFGAFESPGSLLEEGLRRLSKAGLEEPGQFQANAPSILEGEIVPEGEGLATTPPRAGEPPPGRPGGAAPPPKMPKMITIHPERTERLLGEGERRTTEGVSPTGTERRKTLMKGVTTPYDLPTEGEKLAEDVRQSRAGTPHNITEGDALKQIMANPEKYEAYKSADQRTRDRMLVEAKNELLKGRGRKGGVKPPPKMDDFEF